MSGGKEVPLKWTNVCLVFMLLGSLLHNNLHAEENAFYMTSGIGSYDSDQAKDQDTAYSAHIGFEYGFSDRWAAEVSALKLLANDKNFDVGLGRLDGLYYLTKSVDRWRPYLVGGTGYSKREFGFHTIDSLMMNAGAGIKYQINEHFALRTDLRHLHHFDDDVQDTSFSFGLTVKLSGKKAFQVASNNTSKDSETNKRWISLEKREFDSPLSKSSQIQAERQASFSQPENDSTENMVAFTPSYATDEDLDGIPDKKDKCLLTPENITVDKDGCAIDRDFDNVPDYLDQCPYSTLGVVVNKKGCEIVSTVSKPKLKMNIYYDFNSQQLRKQYLSEFEKLAQYLTNHKDMIVQVEGHTDNRGDADYNMKLSVTRAKGIKKILVENFGIDSKRLRVLGRGESQPIANNECYLGRRQNRRVVLTSILSK